MTRHARPPFLLSLLLLLLAGPALAQQPKPPTPAEPKPLEALAGRPDVQATDVSGDLLGAVFESKGNGIALRPPKDTKAVRRIGARDAVEFVDDKRNWTLKLSKMVLPEKASLTEWRDATGTVIPGVLEGTVKRLKEELPDAEVLRQDKITIADADVGMIALRYTKNLQSLLSQQAIVQRSERIYYMLTLTTPGAPTGSKDEVAAGIERPAVETFRQVVDSVKLLDSDAVRADQDARLFRTRGLLVNLTPTKLRETLKPQQWLRILKNGKDVGYTYIEEKTITKGAQENVEIRIRSRVLPDANTQTDVGSILYASMDLRHEDWSTLGETVNLKQRAAVKDYKPPQLAEFGISDRRTVAGQGDVYTLQVQYDSATGRIEPVLRDLPPFYLPQAISHMLPRLVPTDEPKTYLFATYVPDQRELMMRYIDVQDARKVKFNGQLVRATPVLDRLGLEGPVTTHYISTDRVWLGSESKDTGITVVPSDEETLLKLWKDANLTRPEPPPVRKNNASATSDAAADASADNGPNSRNSKQNKGQGSSANDGNTPKRPTQPRMGLQRPRR